MNRANNLLAGVFVFWAAPFASIRAGTGPSGREIIGEKVILELREEYKRRMGEHYRLENFNDNLLVYGALPLQQIRRLMFN